MFGNGTVAVMACGNVDVVQSADWIVKGGDVVKWYLVTVKIDGTITNKLIRANSPEEAEKEALECASRKTMDLSAQN